MHALDAASIAGIVLLLLLLVCLLYGIITEYLARRRFARLLALKNFWLRDGGGRTGVDSAASADARKFGRRGARRGAPPNLVVLSEKRGRPNGAPQPSKHVIGVRKGSIVPGADRTCTRGPQPPRLPQLRTNTLKLGFFAVVVLILAGFGGWVAATTQARIAAPMNETRVDALR
jgi:hypothetical protein